MLPVLGHLKINGGSAGIFKSQIASAFKIDFPASSYYRNYCYNFSLQKVIYLLQFFGPLKSNHCQGGGSAGGGGGGGGI